MSLRTRRIVLVVLSLSLIAVITAVFIRKDASSEASAASTAKVLKITEAKPGQQCPEGFVVKLAGNKGQKLDDAHEAKVNALLVKYQGNELSQEVLNMHLQLAKQDPRFLYMLIQGIPSLQAVAGLQSEAVISRGGCYTAKGREAWKLLRGALIASVVMPTSEAPASGVNTGVNASGVFQTAPGISGNRRAVQYTTKNGFTFWIMYRCGNMVVQHTIPGVPTTVPSGTQPPETGTQPPGGNHPTTVPPHSGTTVPHHGTTTVPHGSTTVPHTTTTRPGKDPSQGIEHNPGAAAQGDTGRRPGGPTPSSPPMNTAPPATYASDPGTVPQPTAVPGPTQPPVTTLITTPVTAPD